MSLTQRLLDRQYPPPPIPEVHDFWRAVEAFLDVAMPIYLAHGWWPSSESKPREALHASIEKTIQSWIENPLILSSRTAHYEVEIRREEVTGNYEIQICLVLVRDMARKAWE